MPVFTRPNGVDYSFDRPAPSALRSSGIGHAARYLTGSGKALTRSEAAGLHASGVGIVLNFEDGAGNALEGARQGLADGNSARAAVAALGAPTGLPIYYSVDFDATPAQIPTVIAYLHAADSPTHPARCYGSYRVVEAFGRPGWQTYAWSYGALSRFAVFYQWSNNRTIDGAAVDYDQVLNPALLGAWEPGNAPSPTPAPIGGTHDMFELVSVGGTVYAVSALSAVHVPNREYLAVWAASALCLNGGKVRAISDQDWLYLRRMVNWNAQSANTATAFDPVPLLGGH